MSVRNSFLLHQTTILHQNQVQLIVAVSLQHSTKFFCMDGFFMNHQFGCIVIVVGGDAVLGQQEHCKRIHVSKGRICQSIIDNRYTDSELDLICVE
jgi:hypothetical protein